MLECISLQLQRGDNHIIKHLQLRLQRGQFVAILGENGAGKSTLLSAFSGELGYRGQLYLEDTEIRDWPRSLLSQKRAVLMQSSNLNFAFNVAELVALGRYPFNESKAQKEAKTAQILHALDLSQMAHREVTELSGGEQQRVQFGRCLAQLDACNPQSRDKLMLLDEPNASLDLHHQHKLLSLAKEFARQGNLVIAVLHDLNLASLYADNVLLLHQGRLQQQGSPQQVFNQATLSSVYRTGMRINVHPGFQVPMIFSEPKEDKNETTNNR